MEAIESIQSRAIAQAVACLTGIRERFYVGRDAEAPVTGYLVKTGWSPTELNSSSVLDITNTSKDAAEFIQGKEGLFFGGQNDGASVMCDIYEGFSSKDMAKRAAKIRGFNTMFDVVNNKEVRC